MDYTNYEDYDDFCCCRANRYELESDSEYVLRKYDDFFEEAENQSECIIPFIYTEKTYDYEKSNQRFFIVGKTVIRILSKEINVWELELNDYDTLYTYAQILEDEREKECIPNDCIVHKNIMIEDKECSLLTLPCNTEYGKDLLEDIFERKEEELLQFEWLRGYNRTVDPR